MDFLKDQLISHLLGLGNIVIFGISFILLISIWMVCEYLEEKEWSLFIKTALGLLILCIVVIIVNINIYIGMMMGNIFGLHLLNSIFLGILTPLVFFKIIPDKGKYIALICVAFMVLFSSVMIFFNIKNGSMYYALEHLLAGVFSVLTYIFLVKGKINV